MGEHRVSWAEIGNLNGSYSRGHSEHFGQSSNEVNSWERREVPDFTPAVLRISELETSFSDLCQLFWIAIASIRHLCTNDGLVSSTNWELRLC